MDTPNGGGVEGAQRAQISALELNSLPL